jgi:hypothetical protein
MLMAQENMKICPTCQGKKAIEGICECAMEWRGTQEEDKWEDCQCTPEQECPSCKGTGFVQLD